jgi:hypothetical protein
MLTPREIENLVKQVNESFAEDRKRISKLEERIATLEQAAAKPAKASKEDK